MAGYSTPAWSNNESPAVSADNLLAMGQAIELSQHPYGVCSTSAATTQKTVTLDYSGTLALFTGLTIRVKFSNSNTAATPTLNVNALGAKPIMSFGTTAAVTWAAGQIIEFVYDGTNWLFDGIDAWTKTQALSANTASAIGSLTGSTPATPDDALGLLTSNVGNRGYFYTGSYMGTGAYGSSNQNSLTFPFVPQLVFLAPLSERSNVNASNLYAFWWTGKTAYYYSGYNGHFSTSNGGKTISWYNTQGASAQLNDSGTSYFYYALG